MKNIVLCGFMGSGKTTVGRLLADKLHVLFVDLDEYIRDKHGLSIPQIFDRFGEEGFRDREHGAVVELLEDGTETIVLAAGGGTLAAERNVDPIRRNGLILFLNPGFEHCYGRIRESDRPLVRANTREELRALHDLRAPLYRRACNYEINTEGGPDRWVEAILRRLPNCQLS